MSSSEEVHSRRHHRSQSAIPLQTATLPSHHPSNHHHLNLQSHVPDTQSDMNYPAQPTTPPRTPRRDYQNQNQTNSNIKENVSKQKPRSNKKRSNNVMISPPVKGRNQITPPLTGPQSSGMPQSTKPINTPSNVIYAGATFHASPAPSALPIPSFYSKSVPDSPGTRGLKPLKETPLPKSNQSSTPPVAPPSGSIFLNSESPLDFFFKADREEKERARSASSAILASKANGPFQPPPNSPPSSQAPLAPNSQYRPGHSSKHSASQLFALELDEPHDPSTPFGPAFSTPYAQRINAAKSTSNRAPLESHNSQDSSEALKAYLFSGHITPSTASSNNSFPNSAPSTPGSLSTNGMMSPDIKFRPQNNGYSPAHDARASHYATKNSTRASGLRQEVTPTKTPARTPDRNIHYVNSPTPARIYGNTHSSNLGYPGNFKGKPAPQNASPSQASPYGVSSGKKDVNLQLMEDDIRRILNIE